MLGNDPATDLRGCGILGLLQLLYLATHQDNETVTKDIYRISLHATQVVKCFLLQISYF